VKTQTPPAKVMTIDRTAAKIGRLMKNRESISSRDQGSGVRGQESGVRGQESGVRGQESGVRGQQRAFWLSDH
jgi:hypothetical protein